MKKICIFLVSLFLSFGFADGYGLWRWGAVPKGQLNSTANSVVAFLLDTSNVGSLTYCIIQYVCFIEDKESPLYYYMRFVFIIYPKDKTKQIHEKFENCQMISRKYSDEKTKPELNDDNSKEMFFLDRPQLLAKNEIQNAPKNYTQVETKYRYNDDTVAIVKEGFYEGQTIVSYTYYEPDY